MRIRPFTGFYGVSEGESQMTQAPAKKGLDGVSIGPSRLSLVNGTEGKLIYAGYKIEDLAANASYEEVVYLLWNDRLPNAKELEALRADIAAQSVIYPQVMEHLKQYPKDANSMAVLRTAVSELAFYDPDSEQYDIDALRRKAIRLTG